ncbi:hypothetical protein pdam_00024644, partial [Pocillopora damicornis]
MIVSPSNPPTQFCRKRPRDRRSTYSRRCPFTFKTFTVTLSCLLVITSPCSQDWTSLAQCLQTDHTGSSSDDILQFIGRHGYMITFTVTLSCLLVITLPCSQDWTSLAQCLQIDHIGSSSDDILRFIGRHGYMIVPPSNPLTQFYRKRPRDRRSTYTRRFPFTFKVKDFIDY